MGRKEGTERERETEERERREEARRERDEETKNQRAGQRESRAMRGERARSQEERGRRRQEGEREGMVVVSSLQCIAFTNPPESRHTPCSPLYPSSYLSPSTNRARRAFHEEIHETSFAVERFGSSRLIGWDGAKGRGEGFREVTRHVSRVGDRVPVYPVCLRADGGEIVLFSGRQRKRTMV